MEVTRTAINFSLLSDVAVGQNTIIVLRPFFFLAWLHRILSFHWKGRAHNTRNTRVLQGCVPSKIQNMLQDVKSEPEPQPGRSTEFWWDLVPPGDTAELCRQERSAGTPAPATPFGRGTEFAFRNGAVQQVETSENPQTKARICSRCSGTLECSHRSSAAGGAAQPRVPAVPVWRCRRLGEPR